MPRLSRKQRKQAIGRLRGGQSGQIIANAYNIERDDRICHLCNSDVGDEFHYIFNSTSLSAERNEYIIQIEQVHFLFSIYSLPKKNPILCKLCKYLQIVIFRVNIYCIVCQEPLQKTLCESILFIFSPYCTWCSFMGIKLSCLVLSCLV